MDTFKAQIRDALEGTKGDPLTREAMLLATARREIGSERELEEFDLAIHDRVEEMRGDPIEEREGRDGGPLYRYDADREQKAVRFAQIVAGGHTPLRAHHENYLRQQDHLKARTIADDVRAVNFLERWCGENGIPALVQEINRQRAALFVDALPALAGGIHASTVKKYRNRLSRYWQWMETREFAPTNVWERIEVRVPQTLDHEKERAFTAEEMRALLTGPASQSMHDLMRIGALSGARLDAIVCLRVSDCADGLFRFKPMKKETAIREVPVHSGLQEIIGRRTEGRVGSAPLFPEWPAPKKVGSKRERSFKASNAFTEYRRKVGVEERVPGRRRALTNFHSFRRWFITMAERADQPVHTIEGVVGHRRKGMSMAVYSDGPSGEQFKRCVEAVVLPS